MYVFSEENCQRRLEVFKAQLKIFSPKSFGCSYVRELVRFCELLHVLSGINDFLPKEGKYHYKNSITVKFTQCTFQ